MRLHLLFSRHRLRPLAKPGRFGDAAKGGAFSKRCRVNSETISIWVRVAFWREICIVRFLTVNLADRAAPAYVITSLNSGLSWLFQVSCILLYLNREGNHNHRQRPCERLTFSQRVRSGKVLKKKSKRRFVSQGELRCTFRYVDTNKMVDSFFSLILPRSLWSVMTSAWRKQHENGFV